jgi:maltodextrin utilization protein YvdJ
MNLFPTNIAHLRTVFFLTESDRSTFSSILNSMECHTLVHFGLGVKSVSAISILRIKYFNYVFIQMLTMLMEKVLRSPTKMGPNMTLQYSD